jgi:hypothetical protein
MTKPILITFNRAIELIADTFYSGIECLPYKVENRRRIFLDPELIKDKIKGITINIILSMK